MLPKWIGLSLVSLAAFLPTAFVLLILWHFDALGEGGPLIVVLLVPALGWYVTHIIRILHNRRNTVQDGIEADLPPKYEKVMSDPPPYEVLYIGKPLQLLTTTGSSPLSHFSNDISPSLAEAGESNSANTASACAFIAEKGEVVINIDKNGELVTSAEESTSASSMEDEGARGLPNAIGEGANGSPVAKAEGDARGLASMEGEGLRGSTRVIIENSRGASGLLEEMSEGLHPWSEENIRILYANRRCSKDPALLSDEDNDPDLPSYEEALSSLSLR